jgi:hypothetical protein
MKPKVGESKKIEIGTMVRIDCPAWFQREDFQKWLNGERVATWHRKGQAPGEYSDAFVTYDWDEGSDWSDMPEDIWNEICSICQERQVTFALIWLSPI